MFKYTKNERPYNGWSKDGLRLFDLRGGVTYVHFILTICIISRINPNFRTTEPKVNPSIYQPLDLVLAAFDLDEVHTRRWSN